MLKVIGGVPDGEYKAIASGSLPNGKPVIVNADGTVSVAGISSISAQVGTAQVFETATTDHISVAYDSNAQKVVIAYRDVGNSFYGTAIVGTVSGTSVSFGTPVVFESGNTQEVAATYDANAQKTVIVFNRSGIAGYAIVGTVSGTSISFGTKVSLGTQIQDPSAVYESNAQKVVLAYRETSVANYGAARVGTVSGTSISFGTQTTFQSNTTTETKIAFDSGNNKVVIACTDSSQQGKAVVGTVSGTSISFGSTVTFDSGEVAFLDIAYDVNAAKSVIVYMLGPGGNQGANAIVGTVSGTSISFGTKVVYDSGSGNENNTIVYHAEAQKVIVVYWDNSNGAAATALTGTVSGSSISFADSTVLESGSSSYISPVYDPNNKVVFTALRDGGNSNYGTGVVYRPAYSATNLTTENYIGMSPGEVEVGSSSLGSVTTFSAGNSPRESAVFDSNSNKVVIAYRDGTNSSYATAVVATVSGETISFGTPVVFNSGSMADAGMAFDSDTNQIIIATYDTLNLNAGTAWVGSVSGTSITFGTKVVYNVGNATVSNKVVYDTANQKVVIAYKDQAQSSYGKAIVGTVSGSSISFGTEVTFNANTTDELAMTYDSSNNKVVLVYQDTGGNSGYGTTIIGTVSGTSISFGTPVVHNASNSPDNAVTFDSINNKVVVGYEVTNTGTYAKVGTVSGTTISYGSAVNFGNSTDWRWASAVFDVNAESVVFAYGDPSNSNNGKIISGAVSGSTITFQPEQTFLSATLNYTGAAYDSLNKKVVVAFQDRTDNYGKAIVSTTGYEKRFPVADGSNVRTNVIGSVSTNQSGLTAGEKYYVQTDGTLSTTAGSPSVLAGTAISATKLVVKT
jgi:hypothetical protein